MKVIIAGSRHLRDYSVVLKAIKEANFDITEVVSGQCAGADELGESWAFDNNVPVKQFPADWNLYKLAAGPIRNRQMAEYADALIAIWDGKVKKSGTYSIISLARARDLVIYIHRLDDESDKIQLPV